MPLKSIPLAPYHGDIYLSRGRWEKGKENPSSSPDRDGSNWIRQFSMSRGRLGDFFPRVGCEDEIKEI